METIEALNQRLIDHYGLDTSTNQPMFRIVWADDQIEKRMMTFTEGGVELLYPTILEVRKYNYLKKVWVLERLVLVPYFQQKELADVKMSYEPLWVFVDATGNPLPPLWEPTKIVIDTLYAALGKKHLAVYSDPDFGPEKKQERIAALQQELFGNETETGDALRYKEGIVVPNNYEKGE
jgi:hypothetical protein